MRSEINLTALVGNVLTLALITGIITISCKASSIIFDTKLKSYFKTK